MIHDSLCKKLRDIEMNLDLRANPKVTIIWGGAERSNRILLQYHVRVQVTLLRHTLCKPRGIICSV